MYWLCSVHYFKHFMYITNFYILSFSAEQFLACAGGLCVWYTIYKASILESSYHRNENSQNWVDPLNSSSSLILNTSLKWRPVLLKKGRFIFHNRNNTFQCSSHSLSIYYGNWCCVKLWRQDNQCGFYLSEVELRVNWLLSSWLLLHRITLAFELMATFQDRIFLNAEDTFLDIREPLASISTYWTAQRTMFGTLSNRTECGLGSTFPGIDLKYGRVIPKSFYTKGCWDCLKTWVTQSREDLISLAIKWNFWPTKWRFCLWFSTACFIISRKMAFDQSQMQG